MRRAFIAVLALAGCSSPSPGVRQTGPNQYVVTASCSVSYCTPQHTATNVALDKANEKCASLGKTMNVIKMQAESQVGSYPRDAWANFECK